MLPLILDPSSIEVGLAGSGPAMERRRAFLTEAGVEPVEIGIDAVDALKGLDVLFVAGADYGQVRELARRARSLGVLVNVEDVPMLCDFHVPATVRRGDLLLTVSSAGRSPGLVRRLREWLADRFGAEWAGRLDMLGRERENWRAEGLPPSEISRKTRALAEEWLT